MLLDRVRVLEAGNGMAVAYCGRVLRSLGAEVFKIEASDDPDWVRSYGAPCAEHRICSCSWCHLNGAKARLAVAAAGSREASRLLAEFAARADIAIAGPGRLGEQLAREGPAGVSLVNIVGAVDPPAGIDIQPDESAGVAAGLRDPYTTGEPATGLRLDIAQVNAGAHAAATATLALARRALGSQDPVRVDVGIYECSFSMIEIAAQNFILATIFEGQLPDLMTSPTRAPYTCKDGGFLAINLWGKDVWQRACAAMGRPELAADPRFIDTVSRWAHPEEVRQILADFCAAYDRDVALARLREDLIPCAPIFALGETLDDAVVKAREAVADDGAHPGGSLASCYVIGGERPAMPFIDAHAAGKLAAALGIPGLETTPQERSDAVAARLR